MYINKVWPGIKMLKSYLFKAWSSGIGMFREQWIDVKSAQKNGELARSLLHCKILSGNFSFTRISAWNSVIKLDM